jgi:hypothetical protein
MPSFGTPPEKISSNGIFDFEKSVFGHSSFQNAGLAWPDVDTITKSIPALIAAAARLHFAVANKGMMNIPVLSALVQYRAIPGGKKDGGACAAISRSKRK